MPAVQGDGVLRELLAAVGVVAVPPLAAFEGPVAAAVGALVSVSAGYTLLWRPLATL